MAQLDDGCWAIANSAEINLKYVMLHLQALNLELLSACTDKLAASSMTGIQRWGRTAAAYGWTRGIASGSQGR